MSPHLPQPANMKFPTFTSLVAFTLATFAEAQLGPITNPTYIVTAWVSFLPLTAVARSRDADYLIVFLFVGERRLHRRPIHVLR